MHLLRAILAVFAVLSMAAVPAGYMPARAADGSIHLMICPGSAAPINAGQSQVSEARDAHAHHLDHGADMMERSAHHPHDAHDSAGFDMRCDYAASAPPVMPETPALAAIAQPRFFQKQRPPVALTGIFPAQIPPSTGPPVS